MRSVDLLAADKGQGSCPAQVCERTGQGLIIGDAVGAAAQWSPRSVEVAMDMLAQCGLAEVLQASGMPGLASALRVVTAH